nr:translation initiation factor IF-2-like [Aegilops tauschii subsp. strangulata]
MNRLLRRSRSADFDSPAAPTRPFAAVPLTAAPPAAVHAPAAAIPNPAAVPAARPTRLAPDVIRGKEPVPEAAPSSSTTTAHGLHLAVAPAPPPVGSLRTAGNVPVPPVSHGAMIPRLSTPDAGSSFAPAGLPSSIAHITSSPNWT